MSLLIARASLSSPFGQEDRQNFRLRLPHGPDRGGAYQIHTGLTENGIPFTLPSRYADGPTDRYITHVFDMRCCENNIAHRPTKVKRPWTNGQSLLRT